MSGISLTASMRSNLLSLQNISGQVSSTQNKLATGNKVNSAIDNPSSYYTALSLNNRADDLNALLDSMGQAVSTIKAATTALESATEFLEQASAVATQALETAKVPSKSFFEEKVGENGAVVTTAQELRDAITSGKETICVYGAIDLGDISTTGGISLKENQKLVGTEYFTGYTGKERFSQLNTNDNLIIGKGGLLSDLTINAELVNNNYAISALDGSTINNIDLFSHKETNTFSGGIMIQGEGQTLTLTGKININHQCQTGSGIYVFNGAVVNSRANLVTTSQSYGGIYLNGTSATLNIIKGRTNISGLYISQGNINLAQSAELNLSGRTSLSTVALNISGRLNILKEDPSAIFTVTGTSSLNIASTAEITAYGEGSLFSLSGQTTATIAAGSKFNLNLNNGQVAYLTASEDSTWTSGTTVSLQNLLESGKFRENTSASEIDWNNWNPLEEDGDKTDETEETETQQSFSQYQSILNQYDTLIKDASYKGINLLQNDKLSVKFNETNTADLSVQGKNMSSQALGFTVFGWETQGDIADSLAEIANALQSIRNYSSELGNNYSIITTRQDFTESLVNVLTEGADKLTLADMNEESANMLALQTRQQLAINSLSLASQASQSILKLF